MMLGGSLPSHLWHVLWGIALGWVRPLGLVLRPSQRICDTLNSLLKNPFLFKLVTARFCCLKSETRAAWPKKAKGVVGGIIKGLVPEGRVWSVHVCSVQHSTAGRPNPSLKATLQKGPGQTEGLLGAMTGSMWGLELMAGDGSLAWS